MAALDRRKKVTKACDYCKKRKYKCSGQSPCELCTKKKIQCQFSMVDRRTTKSIAKSNATSAVAVPNQTISNGAISSAIASTVASNRTNGFVHPTSRDSTTSKSPYTPKSLQPLLSFPLQEDIHANCDSENMTESVSNNSESTDDFERRSHQSARYQEPKSNKHVDLGRSNKTSIPSPTTQLSNNHGKSSRLLFDSAGNLRYIGESSPLSLLFECRNIFQSTIGECEFTSDPQCINIIDEPAKINNSIPVQLPKREHCNILVKFFETNVNTTWYVVNMKYFKESVVDYIYDNPIRACHEKLVLLHLVLALGLLYAETSKSFLIEDLESSQINSLTFFESGCNLMRNTVDTGKLWLSEAYFLIYFYYQSTSKRSTSWIMLGTAIRNAQALGLHRKFINESFRDREYIMHRRKLWRSLYVCDRISSILLGRPLLIGDYDWDDFDSDDLIKYEDNLNHDKNTYCLIEISKVCKINGRIVHDFYLDGIIDPARAEKLAIELKLWSTNLPKELQVDQLLISSKNGHDITSDSRQRLDHQSDRFSVSQDNFALLLVHISQLYGIMLLSKPFFMYIAFKRNRENSSEGNNKHEITMANFCRASVKSSVLTIQLIHLYKEQHPQRIESYVTVNCCLMAALILGLSILHRKTEPNFIDEYSIAHLMESLNTAKSILSFYGPINATSQRFYKIVGKMQRSLEAAFGDMESMIASSAVSPADASERNARMTAFSPAYVGAEAGAKETMALDRQVDNGLSNERNNNGNDINNTNTIDYTANNENSEYYNTNNKSVGLSLPQTPFSNSATDLKTFMNFQQFFVPSSVGAVTESNDFATQTTTPSTGEPLDVFMYNMGTNDILFDGNI